MVDNEIFYFALADEEERLHLEMTELTIFADSRQVSISPTSYTQFFVQKLYEQLFYN